MKRFKVFLIIVFLAVPLTSIAFWPPSASKIAYTTKANLPGSPVTGDLAGITDGNTASDCTTGGGSNWNLCVYNGSAWVIQGDGTGASGSGSMTTVQEGDVGVGDTDIVTLDFGTGFTIGEDPNTEINVKFDLTPEGINATLKAANDALQVKFDPTDFAASTNGLYLGASPTIVTSLAIGANPADAGTGIRLSNTNVIEFEDTEGTGEVTALSVDASEAVIIGDANASGVTITPALTLSSTFTDGVLTGDGVGGITGIVNLNSVIATELAELETLGTTTISAAQWTGLGGATTAGIALWDDVTAAAQLITLGVDATASEIDTPLDGASVTLTEFRELEAIGETTISAAQWTGLGGATTAGIALWDDADNVAQLVTLGVDATASEINTPLDGASVTLTEFRELEAINATTISTGQWTGLGAATVAGIALWDDASAGDQLTTLGAAPIASPTFTGVVSLPNNATPTTDTVGDIAVDLAAWTRDAIEFFDGTESTYLIGMKADDAPADGEVPQWNTGGTITWEAAGAGDIIGVGDCVTGTCYDGADTNSGNYIRLWDGDSHYLQIDVANLTGNATVILGSDTNNLTIANGSATVDLATGVDLNLDVDFTADGQKTTITGVTQANVLTLNEGFTIGDGNVGTLTFSGATKTLTVELDSLVNQDLTSDAAPTFVGIDLGDANLTSGGSIEIDAITAEATNVLFGTGAATQFQIRDSAIYIASLNDGYLDLEADTGIRMNGPVTFVSATFNLPTGNADPTTTGMIQHDTIVTEL